MQINIHIAQKLSDEIKLITDEYIKRLQPLRNNITAKLVIKEYKTEQAMLKTVTKLPAFILVKHNPITMDSNELSEYLIANHSLRELNFVISDEIQSKRCLALTKMKITKLSQLLLLTEQIYRGYSIINNSQYHK